MTRCASFITCNFAYSEIAPIALTGEIGYNVRRFGTVGDMCMLDEIRARRDEIYAIARRHKAEKLWVFGSCARKEDAT